VVVLVAVVSLALKGLSNILERPNKDNTIGLNFIDHGDIEDCSTNGTAPAY
jgi:hypothetical protein